MLFFSRFLEAGSTELLCVSRSHGSSRMDLGLNASPWVALAGTVSTRVREMVRGDRKAAERAGTGVDSEALLRGTLGGDDCAPQEPHSGQDCGSWRGGYEKGDLLGCPCFPPSFLCHYILVSVTWTHM